MTKIETVRIFVQKNRAPLPFATSWGVGEAALKKCQSATMREILFSQFLKALPFLYGIGAPENPILRTCCVHAAYLLRTCCVLVAHFVHEKKKYSNTLYCVLVAYLVRSCCVLGIFYFWSTRNGILEGKKKREVENMKVRGEVRHSPKQRGKTSLM